MSFLKQFAEKEGKRRSKEIKIELLVEESPIGEIVTDVRSTESWFSRWLENLLNAKFEIDKAMVEKLLGKEREPLLRTLQLKLRDEVFTIEQAPTGGWWVSVMGSRPELLSERDMIRLFKIRGLSDDEVEDILWEARKGKAEVWAKKE